MIPSNGQETDLPVAAQPGPKAHRFIVLAEQCLSRQEAEERALAVIRAYGFKESKSKIKEHGVTFTNPNGKRTQLAFADLVAEARRTGVVPELDRDLWP